MQKKTVKPEYISTTTATAADKHFSSDMRS